MKKLLLVAFTIPLLFSCGKEENKTNNTDDIEYNETSTAVKEQPTVNHLVIKANENMTFDKTEFVVKAGEELTLLLLNDGTSPKEAMGHNVVVLNQGTDVDAFAFAASSAAENDYIPKDKENEIIIHTKLLGPKESDQVKFKFDKPGTYNFICSFPGHSATMRGKIKVIE